MRSTNRHLHLHFTFYTLRCGLLAANGLVRVVSLRVRVRVRVAVTPAATVSVCVRLSLRSHPSATVTASTSSGATNTSAVRRPTRTC